MISIFADPGSRLRPVTVFLMEYSRDRWVTWSCLRDFDSMEHSRTKPDKYIDCCNNESIKLKPKKHEPGRIPSSFFFSCFIWLFSFRGAVHFAGGASSFTMSIPLLVPIRTAPAASISLAMARLLMPVEAFTRMDAPTVLFIKRTSSTVAPPEP